MAIRVALQHRTRYTYDRPVQLGPQIIRLRPAPHTRSPIVGYSLQVEPEEHFLNWQQDPQGNYLARAVFPEETLAFETTVDLVIDLAPVNPFDFFLEEEANDFPFEYSATLKEELEPFLPEPKSSTRFDAFVKDIEWPEGRTIDFLAMVNQKVNTTLAYTLRMDPGIYSPEETLRKGSGSCRDFAWLLVHVFRHFGLAARFVSGYSIQLKADEKPVDPDAPAGVEEDICDLHAWCEVYLPGAGWVGLDATSGLFCGEGHIPLATSANALNAAPIEGKLSYAKTQFDVEMSVTRIHEDPRVTLPYTEGQWQTILALGDQVDRELLAGDVRLSMGGEPTFIHQKDPEGAEWNTEAVGPTKKPLSEKLIRQFRERFAPGGFLHHGQGKWYPGEPLPRWALGLYWRKDGVPLWENDALLDSEESERKFTHEDAEDLASEIAHQLQVDDEYVQAAYEDPVYFSLRERNLPVNVDPTDSKLDDPQEREQLMTVFNRGLEKPTGYILPVERIWLDDAPAWQSGLWMLRGKHIFLAPGDSPVGLRLPLKSLPWVPDAEYPYVYPSDPSRNHPSLPRRRARVTHQRAGSMRIAVGSADTDQEPEVGESAPWVVRTALCVEARKGHLYVFFPPMGSLEDYIDLLTAVEHAAAQLKKPVMIEGYGPPEDPRVEQMKVTPDPGVIEVNIHPATSWRELVDNTTTIYREARELYLGTEKFQLDGRHTGTGGGNHLVVGGLTPADSPFLRRPDLLKSLLGFWLNHPSLSYLFSGLFIGPTSQAPRVDEGRVDAVYELDIAFQQIPGPGMGNTPPWLIDRILRHLLTDLTGNTHRAEFCIDKLYSPDSATGRLGLVEFRGFEMPPHPRMSLTQQLLLRALIAHFWQRPSQEPLIRWGSDLHDRFLLPEFVHQDFEEVIQTLQDNGYAFQRDWFENHFEFRFPVIGTHEVDDIHIEVRQAIEPWLVLGEEPGGGGTSRYVDSSIDRVQVKVTGFNSERYALAVNSIEVPLTALRTPGEFVAGIRFRAWQPPSCLHPTIPVQAPLVFDIVDRYQSRAIGGCTYRVSHPGGRAHETFPINALEAETRRAERFDAFGHTPGPFVLRQIRQRDEAAVTLDLRLAPFG